MHVNAKQVAFLGILAALATLLIILASILEMNTLFLLAAAAFMVGIAIREFGLRLGSGFFVACSLLGLLLSPNKLYMITYIGLALYIVFNEATYKFLSRRQLHKNMKVVFLFIKLLFFNVLYIPVLFLFPQLLFAGTIQDLVLLLMFAGGQLGWLVYDKAYEYFQVMVWGKLRGKMRI